MDNSLHKKKRIVIRQIVKAYFKNNKGEPFILTDGQCDVAIPIFFKEDRRVEVIAPTQYGKSETLAMALILRSQIFQEPWWIITGQQTKSDIIMQKAIAHLFDSEDLLTALDLDPATPLERLKRERSRERLVWREGGEIRAITADANNRRRVTDTLSGLGNENILEDEASLIPDDLQAMVMRMLGGHAGGYLIKIGNPYNRGHFLKSWKSKLYKKVFIDYHQALREGRYTPEFIAEMKEEPFFDVLYECLFPNEAAQDRDGYYRLLTDEELEAAYSPDWKEEGETRFGFDPGEGGDESAGVKRNKKYAKTLYHQKLADPMDNVSKAKDIIKAENIAHKNAFWDANGIGSGGYARLKELGIIIVSVRWGEDAYDKKTYANNKAEQYWKLRVWVRNGGKISDRGLLDELKTIKYKEDTSGRTKIKSKEDMRKEGIKSPNRADALAMTFDKNADEQAPQVITL